MPQKSYLVAYLVQISEFASKVVIVAVTRYEPPLIKVFNTLEEASSAVFGITGAHLPEPVPVSKEVFRSKIEKLQKEDEKLALMSFDPVLKSLT